jgi:hypothetical protein
LEIKTKCGEDQGERIRKVMACIGQQGQAAGAEARESFYGDERDRRPKRPFQDAAGTMMMMVMMRHRYFYLIGKR